MNTTSYRYNANDKESYMALMKEVCTTFATVTLIPSVFAIIVTPPAEHPEQINDIGKFIDRNSLNFRIEPVEADESLKAQLEKYEWANKYQKEESEKYKKWWSESIQKQSRIKEQVKSIAVLLSAIYPEC